MLTVYTVAFVPAVRVLGCLPDQTITDKGSETLLLAFVCHHVFNLFRLANGLVQPAMRRVHRFVPSTRNKIERLWGEVNVRVNLPFEAGLCAHGVE